MEPISERLSFDLENPYLRKIETTFKFGARGPAGGAWAAVSEPCLSIP
jgi:hypothetical protein